jgi:hypothetical protein
MATFRARPEALLEDPKVWDTLRKIAGEVARDANRTRRAKIGITYRDRDDGVLITSRGAPAVALEVGTSSQPARRYVKRALDSRRSG